jgi:hypothetical protein
LINSLFFPKSNNQLKYWFLFHIIFGVLSTISVFFLIGWFYIALISGILKIYNSNTLDKKIIHLILLLFYIAPFEMVCRMANTSPLIPFELGKYISFFLLVYGLSLIRVIDYKGILLVLLLIPGILLGWSHAPDYRYIIFNVLGLINLGLGIGFFGGVILKNNVFDMNASFRLLVYPLLIAVVYAFIKTPKYDEITFDLGANFDASGGFGSNQVSTAFGLGLFLVFYFWLKGILFTGFNKFFDFGIAMLFLFQGLLTFSRGGIIGGVLGILLLVFNQWFLKNNKNVLSRISKLFLLGIPLIIFTFLITNDITQGKLLQRYQGETAGTLAGVKEKTLNNVTTGRYDIFLGDVAIFLNHPIFGVGVNESRYYRNYAEGVVAHVELSRLLSEHGILGLIIFLYLIFILAIKMKYLRTEYSILIILFILGLYTTFHAATRTFMSPLIMAMACIPIKSIQKSKKQSELDI